MRNRPDLSKCGSGRHDWVPENIRHRADGRYECRLCANERGRLKRARRRALDPIPSGRRIPHDQRLRCEEVLEEFEALRCSKEEAALRLNMTRSAFERALYRARKKQRDQQLQTRELFSVVERDGLPANRPG